MKKWIIKISILFSFIFMITSCAKKEMKDYFINSKNEYWVVYSGEKSRRVGTYYQFNSDMEYNRFRKDENEKMIDFNTDGDLIYDNRKWSISNDSILSWDGYKYDVISFTDDFIILMYGDSQNYTFLFKYDIKNSIKSVQYYFEKRLKYPERYKPIWEE